MTKLIAYLCILLGLGVGIILPWAKLNFFDQALASVEFNSFGQGVYYSRQVELTPENNPVRVRFLSKYKADGKLPPLKIPMRFDIKDEGGKLLTGYVSFSTRGVSTGPTQPSIKGSQSIQFNVQNAQMHDLSLMLAPNDNDGGIHNPDVENVTATFYANANDLRTSYTIPALVVAFFGFYLLIRGRRKRGEK